MALDRPVVFPLRPIVWSSAKDAYEPSCTCALGADCGRIGKHAAVLWRDLKAGDEVPRPEAGAGVAIKCGARPKGSGIVVVDLDGSEAQDAWIERGGSLTGTRRVRTGRGAGSNDTVGDGSGLQLYFEHPGFYVKTTAGQFAPGIDIRGDGGICVAPGSPHKAGPNVKYTLEADLPPAPLPEFLLEWLRRQPAQAEAQAYDGDVEGAALEAARAAYVDYLLKDAPLRGIRGQGDANLWRVVQYGAWDLALPSADVLELLEEHYDPRCSPPWGIELEEKVLHKCDFAKTKSTRPRKGTGSVTDEELTAWLALEGGLTTGGGVPPTQESKGPGRGEAADGEAILPGSALVPKPKPAKARTFEERIRWGGWSAEPPPQVFLVDGLLIQNKVAMIYADPGGIKTWTALDLALAIATGSHWLGERAVKRGPALYMDYEDGEEEFHRRVRLLSRGMCLEAEDAPDLGYIYSPGKIDDDRVWMSLAALYLKKPFSFLVIDTLRASNTTQDENDTRAAGGLDKAGNFTEMFKDTAMPPTVLVIHHSNKSGTSRGTSAFKGAVDIQFKLETEEDTDKRHRAVLICEKSGQKKPAPIRLELTDEGLRTWLPDTDGEGGVKERELTDEEIRAKILLVLEANGVVASKRKLRDLVKARAERVETELTDLIAAGEVAKVKEGFILDNDVKRRARVIASVERFDYWTTEAELAADAGVPTLYVHELKRLGVIGRRASGDDVFGFVVLKK